MANDRFVETIESVYRNSRFIITREYGKSPEGVHYNGAWVVRVISTGEYVAHSNDRHLLLEKYI